MSERQMQREGTLSRTHARILEASCEEFADHGFAGARTERIARRAGVNKAALYYHVGNKKALYDALLADALSGLRGAFKEEEALQGKSGPEGRLDAFIRLLAGLVAEKRALWQIVLRGYGEDSGGLAGGMAQIMDSIHTEFTGIINDGRSMGVFRRDCDPQVGLSMVLGGIHLLNSGGIMHESKTGKGFSYQPQMQKLQPVPLAEELSRSLIAAFQA